MKEKRSIRKAGGRHTENSLQRARMKAGITQEEAADAISCGTRTLQRYERGERQPNLAQLQKMQQCYNFEIADLFPDDKGGTQ